MKLVFSGFCSPIEIAPGCATTLEVHNKTLFARVCMSLRQSAGSEAMEPYSWWDEEGVPISPNSAALVVGDLTALPWSDRRVLPGALKRMGAIVGEDEDLRSAIGALERQIVQHLSQAAYVLQSDYAFDVDWSEERLLKAFGVGVDLSDDESLLDRCIKFLSCVSDAACVQSTVFVNLKLFLSETDLEQVFERAFFLGMPLLLLENVPDRTMRCKERKYVVDQDLLESW